MARIICIDYGGKRTGIAVTDPFQIIATGLTTIETKNFIPFLKDYLSKEQVELIVIGMPTNWDDSDTHGTPLVRRAIDQLKKHFPTMPIETVDERYTSKMAKNAMLEMGLKKSQRRDKKLVDEIAATIMLQEYLGRM
jgi:putative Holliday junction resolvase